MQPLLSRIRNAFAIQLRQLAIFRVLLGLIAAWDLWGRFQLRFIVFGDPTSGNQILREGLIPTRLSAEAWTPWNWSLLWMDRATTGIQQVIDNPVSSTTTSSTTASSEAASAAISTDPFQHWIDFFSGVDFASGVILAGIAFALLFAAGLFTRVSNFLLWVVVVSVQVRMPLFTTGADTLEKLFLFWSLWLPVSAVGSLDARFFSRHGFWRKRINQTIAQLKETQPGIKDSQLSISTFATAAMMLQFIAMYFFTGLAKCNEQWFSGNAISQSFQWTFYVRPLGDWLAQQHWLLTPATFVILGVELFSPILVFVPGVFQWTRRPAAWILIAMHLAIAATMTIGTFSALAITGWMLFFGSLRDERGLHWIWRDGRDQSLRPARVLIDSPRALATARDYCIAVLGAAVLWWNFSESNLRWAHNSFPDWLKPPMYQLALNQDFPMFAKPAQQDWRWSHQLTDGTNLRTNLPAPISAGDRPRSGFGPHEEFLWRQLHVNLLYCQNESFKEHVVQRWSQWERSLWESKNAGQSAAGSKLVLIDNADGQIQSEGWGTKNSSDSK